MMRAYLKSLVHEKGAPAKQVVAGGRLSEEKCYSFYDRLQGWYIILKETATCRKKGD